MSMHFKNIRKLKSLLRPTGVTRFCVAGSYICVASKSTKSTLWMDLANGEAFALANQCGALYIIKAKPCISPISKKLHTIVAKAIQPAVDDMRLRR